LNICWLELAQYVLIVATFVQNALKWYSEYNWWCNTRIVQRFCSVLCKFVFYSFISGYERAWIINFTSKTIKNRNVRNKSRINRLNKNCNIYILLQVCGNINYIKVLFVPVYSIGDYYITIMNTAPYFIYIEYKHLRRLKP